MRNHIRVSIKYINFLLKYIIYSFDYDLRDAVCCYDLLFYVIFPYKMFIDCLITRLKHIVNIKFKIYSISFN